MTNSKRNTTALPYPAHADQIHEYSKETYSGFPVRDVFIKRDDENDGEKHDDDDDDDDDDDFQRPHPANRKYSSD